MSSGNGREIDMISCCRFSQSNASRCWNIDGEAAHPAAASDQLAALLRHYGWQEGSHHLIQRYHDTDGEACRVGQVYDSLSCHLKVRKIVQFW